MEENKHLQRVARLTHEGIVAALEADRESQPCEDGIRSIYPSSSVSRAISDLNLLHAHQLGVVVGATSKQPPSADIEEQAFDAAHQIKRLIGEAHIGGMDQLHEKIHTFLGEVLADTVEQLVGENARMHHAINQTIAWQQSVDGSNMESVRPLLDLETQATDAAVNDLRAQGLDMFRDTYLSGVAKDLATSFAELVRKGGA